MYLICDFGNPFNKNLKKLQEWQEIIKDTKSNAANIAKRKSKSTISPEDALRDLRRKRKLNRDPLANTYKEYSYKNIPNLDEYTDVRKVNDPAIKSGYVGFPNRPNSFMEEPIPLSPIKLYKSRISGKTSIPKKYKKYEEYLK